MILLSFSDAGSIVSLHRDLGFVLDYIKAHDLGAVYGSGGFGGRLALRGDDLYINIGVSDLLPASARLLELHRRYIDIHIPLSGVERIGWRAAATLTDVESAYNEDMDYGFYRDAPTTYVDVAPGELLIATPADGHAPLIAPAGNSAGSSGTLLKAVVKIRI